MVANMRTAYLEQSDASQIAMVVPHLKEMNAERITHYIAEAEGFGFKRIHFKNEKTLFVACAIASGSMIKTEILNEHGLMNEDFFIDYIDTEYCLRLTSLGHRILAVNNAVLEHTLGAQTTHGKAHATNHSPQRRYTIYRNRTITWKMYMFKAPKYITYDIMASMFDMYRIIAYEGQKWPKIRSAVKGMMHGLFCSHKPSPQND
jgi:rhamnosyltransferase